MVLVEVSNRHVHLCKDDLEVLFGKDYALTKLKDLSQPGEFAAEEKVSFQNLEVRVLGPVRAHSQLEISHTDARNLKHKAELRLSGDVADVPVAEISTELGSVKVPIIIAKRHLHCSEEDAKRLSLKDGQLVSVRVDNTRPMTFHDIPVRIKENAKLALHLDADEGNAAGIQGMCEGELI
ncbi:propanediol utilization protein [Candidatus Woesearchaeota archaeon]|jgi:putative phosphotransacetylase|nr:propanediol utilization protein [Candidatus Woesearchaeota archaeon]MBT4368434.1 propanediol utilization protein [Candidatus Woesearchaeota archaeon]MBT4712923.1 propanediol utilization protein [Candidatus Woesearchaeota archaeon]MBT6639835.1 propanediol utilization protein [Candidatus Woesearchaeota archaeon]MBT7134007.1 propanediol utilization protein [Candidatus Woesearchaeota archaeon]